MMILFTKKNCFSLLFLSHSTIAIYLICTLGVSDGSVLATDVFPSPLETLFNEMEQSTVKVVNTIPTNLFNPQVQNQTELGTGFVFDDEEHIITAYHVLSGATTVNIITNEGERYEARLLGADPYSDVAVLEIEKRIPISFDIFLLTIKELINPVTENVSKILLLLVPLSVFKSPLGIWAER